MLALSALKVLACYNGLVLVQPYNQCKGFTRLAFSRARFYNLTAYCTAAPGRKSGILPLSDTASFARDNLNFSWWYQISDKIMIVRRYIRIPLDGRRSTESRQTFVKKKLMHAYITRNNLFVLCVVLACCLRYDDYLMLHIIPNISVVREMTQFDGTMKSKCLRRPTIWCGPKS